MIAWPAPLITSCVMRGVDSYRTMGIVIEETHHNPTSGRNQIRVSLTSSYSHCIHKTSYFLINWRLLFGRSLKFDISMRGAPKLLCLHVRNITEMFSQDCCCDSFPRFQVFKSYSSQFDKCWFIFEILHSSSSFSFTRLFKSTFLNIRVQCVPEWIHVKAR